MSLNSEQQWRSVSLHSTTTSPYLGIAFATIPAILVVLAVYTWQAAHLALLMSLLNVDVLKLFVTDATLQLVVVS